MLLERPAPAGRPTLLLYSHYDVISPEPIERVDVPAVLAPSWSTARSIGRGSTDAKANVLSLVKAIESLVAVRGEAPCGVKLILDGEEERGSAQPTDLRRWLARSTRTPMRRSRSTAASTPAACPRSVWAPAACCTSSSKCAARKKELHSGGARLYLNPAWRLTWALASIKGPDERVLIDGFYDDLVPPTDARSRR